MRLASIYRPALGTLIAAIVLLGSLLIVSRSVDAADEGAPSVTPTVRAERGGDGWYVGKRVSLDWDVAGAPRGVKGADCAQQPPADGDLLPTAFTCTVTLPDGTTISGSVEIKIDRTPPELTCPDAAPVFGMPIADPNATPEQNATAAATLAEQSTTAMGSAVIVSDAGSGPTADGAKAAPIDISTATAPDAPRKVDLTASDAAGNTATQTCTYAVIADTTPPLAPSWTITPTPSAALTPSLAEQAAVNNGWYTGDVTVAFSYADAYPADQPQQRTQIVAQQGCDPVTITTDTPAAGQAITCTATSGGGVSPATTVVIRRDATPPTITCPAPPQVIQGNSVTVQAAVSDAASGAAEPTASEVGDDYPLGEHLVSITGRDVAGNTATAQCPYVVIPDPNAPVITATIVGPTGAADQSLAASAAQPTWYTGDVAVTFAIDAASPLIDQTGCAPATITADTPGTTLTCTVTSSGGTTSRSVTVARDATPPAVACPSPAPVFVNGAAAQLAAAFADATSGATADSATLPVDTSQIGVHSLAVSAQDHAGNVAQAQCDYQVIPDYSAPAIRTVIDGTAGKNGWYTGTVTVSFVVTDDDSPVTTLRGCDTRVIDQDTAGATVDCWATSYGGASHDAVVIKRDTAGPAMRCLAVDFVQGSPGRVSAESTDGVSGVAGRPVFAQANTNTLGARHVTLTSSDQAGNVSSIQCGYTVLAAANVKAANITRSGQDVGPPLMIAGFLVIMGGIGLALVAHRRTAGRHSASS